ncbi:MAG TPA: prolyl oligopeptidase family serine peptidase [Saprospiraceae bacterium]|nr:prolyl oligopeptidase family serine peptidase [Saprospiraceae bacterium]
MKNNVIYVLAAISIFLGCDGQKTGDMANKYSKMTKDYPDTKKVEVTENYHGQEVSDPYRWLEVDTAAEVEDWVDRQNEVTFSYLEEIPYRSKIEERYREIFNYEKRSAPYKAGDYYFFYKNDGLQNQAVIYRQKGLEGEPEVFIDPNEASDDGTVDINIRSVSPDDKYVVISKQEAGSDWAQLKVLEVNSGEDIGDELNWTKFTSIAWKNDGFYYSRYPKPAEGTEYSKANEYHSIYYHKLGDSQEKDKLIYRNELKPKMYHWATTTEDEKYLIMSASTGTDGYETFYLDLDDPSADFVKLFSGFKHKNTVVDHKEGDFYVLTDIDAPNYRLVKFPVNNPEKENWKDIIAENEHLLQSVNTAGGKLFAVYIQDVTNRAYQMNYDGSSVEEITLPGTGSLSGLGGKKEDEFVFYTFTSFLNPGNIYKYDIASNSSDIFWSPELAIDLNEFVEKQVFYTSKDGTKVPMFIVHKKGLELNGNNPALLYGYGGFNVSLTPSFSTSRLILLENGGVFALANLRGGGEYGEEWHQQGMLENKQNVFDDFISAAEYLISEGYTSSDKLGIQGGSNGGLLVGACMTQRPDLFQVAFPAVGVMDMLRFHKFTVGWGWVPEYGSSDTLEHFDFLYDYSPYHNLKDSVDYPATMITTADHDDRVVPAHSFKFAARLQEYHSGEDPVLIRIEKKAGHGAGKPTSKIIEEQTDIWTFFFANTETELME